MENSMKIVLRRLMLSPCPWVQEQTKYIKLHRWEPPLRTSELPTENLPFIKKSYQFLSNYFLFQGPRMKEIGGKMTTVYIFDI